MLISAGSLYKIAFDALVRCLHPACFVELKQLQSNDESETNYLNTGKIDISHRDEVPIKRRAKSIPHTQLRPARLYGIDKLSIQEPKYRTKHKEVLVEEYKRSAPSQPYYLVVLRVVIYIH